MARAAVKPPVAGSATASLGAASERLSCVFCGSLVQTLVQTFGGIAVTADGIALRTASFQIVVLDVAGSSPVSHPSEALSPNTADKAFLLECLVFPSITGRADDASAVSDETTSGRDVDDLSESLLDTSQLRSLTRKRCEVGRRSRSQWGPPIVNTCAVLLPARRGFRRRGL